MIMSESQNQHWAVFITNSSKKTSLIHNLLGKKSVKPDGFESLAGKKGALFSKIEIDKLIEEEVRHDNKLLTSHTSQNLQSFSSGERKKALFNYLLESDPEYLILDNPLDNLDKDSQVHFKKIIEDISSRINIVQLLSRASDLLPCVNKLAVLQNGQLSWFQNKEEVLEVLDRLGASINGNIPSPLEILDYDEEYLIRLRNVNVAYGEKAVLKNINWDIKPGEYWELAGKNGSGKTTILSMITGDNPKGYGQEIFLFGTKKGSGESIWDIKKKIGYFTPAMIDRFRGYHSLENMLISGILDSIGLYVIPSAAQIRLAQQWLALVGLDQKKDSYFHDLSLGHQRLIMCIRAMIKHPLLLILDEPTAGLDDASASMVVSLVNKMAEQSDTTIIFVSHRQEPNLNAQFTYQLNTGTPDLNTQICTI